MDHYGEVDEIDPDEHDEWLHELREELHEFEEQVLYTQLIIRDTGATSTWRRSSRRVRQTLYPE